MSTNSELLAQSIDARTLATAQALHDQAIKAMDRKDYAHACPDLEEVVRLVPDGMGARLTLAECYDGAGRLASAWTTYVLVDSIATKPNQVRHRETAHKRAEALKPRLAKLKIEVPDAVRAISGLEIKRDDISVGKVQWGVALPVDKGKHLITVTAPDKRQWEQAIQIQTDGIVESITVEQPAYIKATAPSSQFMSPDKDADQTSPPKPDSSAKSSRIRRTAGLVAGGVGVAGVAVGAALGITAIVKQSQSNSDGHCRGQDGNYCDPIGMQLRDTGRTVGTASTVMFITGSIALAGGITLFMTSPQIAKTAETKVAIGPRGFEILGSW